MSRLWIDRLVVGYRDRPVLGEVSVRLAEREILVLVGPSGCGKSTLLRTLAGLAAPLSGRALVDGEPVHGPGRDRVLVFQDDGLLPWRSVRRNVVLPLVIGRVPRARRRAEADRWLARVGLLDAAHRLPRELSGGMRQRAQLARALAGGPGLLLMDEPFGALDAQTRAAMQRLLIEVWRAHPRTIVFVTHDIDEALALGDRIAVLRPGLAGEPARPGIAELIDVPAPRDGRRDPGLRGRVLAALASGTRGPEHADSTR